MAKKNRFLILAGIIFSSCVSGYAQEVNLKHLRGEYSVDESPLDTEKPTPPPASSPAVKAPAPSSPAVKKVESIVIGSKPAATVGQKDTISLASSVNSRPAILKVEDMRAHTMFDIITASDEVIEQRIKKIERDMPMPYNENVKHYIEYFLYKRPQFVKDMLERKDMYFPIFEKYLKENGMPDEMKYLALLESGLNPKAVSRSKAVGLWQFMSFTGKEMGLTINDYVDERMHIEKSTDASFKYLKKIYKEFGDWELALASYNTGPGRIKRTIRKAGSEDYWSLHPYLHPDTRAYVPQWASLNYLVNYAADHGIFPDYEKTLTPVATEYLVLNGPLNLKTFAELNHLSLDKLKLLNPHILKDEIPSYAKNLDIAIPKENYAYYTSNADYILDSAKILSQPEVLVAQNSSSSEGYEYKQVKRYHTVGSGDYLGKIAARYGTSVSQLRKWNNLSSSTIQKGQRIYYYTSVKVPTSAGESATEAQEETTAPVKIAAKNTEQRSNVKIATEKVEVVPAVAAAPTPFHYEKKEVKKYHFVRSGENLTEIARKYGTSINELKKWNSLSGSTIQKGQKLAYYTTVSEKVYDKVNINASGEFTVHTVQKGDTLWNISQKYGFSVEELKKINGITDNTVKVGQKLKVKTS